MPKGVGPSLSLWQLHGTNASGLASTTVFPLGSILSWLSGPARTTRWHGEY